MTYFAVIREQGPTWNESCSMREQEHWLEHASYMNALAEQGFFVFAGPLRGSTKILLVIRSDSEEALRERLKADPWTSTGLLQVRSVEPWDVLVGKEEIDRVRGMKT
jgi:uncharacterized protein YciI